jgi:hypothetical protein
MLNGFSEAVLCELLCSENKAATSKLARRWHMKYPGNAKQAAVELGLQLHKNFKRDWCCGMDFVTVIVALAMARVDWTRVARVVLERFARPVDKNDCLRIFLPRSPALN